MGLARLKKHIPQLKALKKASPKRRRKILIDANAELIKCICECCLNIINGNVKITKAQRRKLSRHAKTLRALAKRGVPTNRKKKLIVQKGGFLPALLAPIIGLAGSLVGSLLG